MSHGHVIHVCGCCCDGGKREDTGCFGELGRLRSVYVNSGSLALALAWALVAGTALADQMSYLSKTMRLRVSKALHCCTVQDVAGVVWVGDCGR